MLLRDYLMRVGEYYDQAAGFDTEPQHLLRDAKTELVSYVPPDFVVKASGGQFPLKTTETPWIGFFDPEESTRPQQGLYVVWILASGGGAWTLSLNMGTENRAKRLKSEEAATAQVRGRESRLLTQITAEATLIREAMDAEARAGWDASIDLASDGVRQKRYEAATVLARTYRLDSLPDDATLHIDLARLCRLLGDAARARRAIAATNPDAISTASSTAPPRDRREYVFEPGEDRSGPVRLPRKPIERTPRHEGGLRRYGDWLMSRGFRPATNVHPRDFIIQGSPEWIGEYKVVYGTDVTRATREAHSQLKEYRHFLYPSDPTTPLLAVFSDPVTDERVAWLNAEGIAVAWYDGETWRGCPLARAARLGDA